MKERTVASTRQRRKAVEKTTSKSSGSNTTSAKAKSTSSKSAKENGTSDGKQRSDVFLSISPPCMSKIAARTENYEFRRYLLPTEVKRMWVYVSSPEQALRYIATVGPGKQPGEIDEEGASNADFNAGRKNDMPFAYEILELYELKNPVSLSDMKSEYGATYPQRYRYTPQKMLDDIVVEDQTRLF